MRYCSIVILLFLLTACAHHPGDCAIGGWFGSLHDDCLPGTAGYEENLWKYQGGSPPADYAAVQGQRQIAAVAFIQSMKPAPIVQQPYMMPTQEPVSAQPIILQGQQPLAVQPFVDKTAPYRNVFATPNVTQQACVIRGNGITCN